MITIAAATIVSECRSSAICDSVLGSTNVWLASTSEARIITPPPSPKIPKPGMTSTSSNKQSNPPTNNRTSNQPAVPCKKLLQKNNRNATDATKPPTPSP